MFRHEYNKPLRLAKSMIGMLWKRSILSIVALAALFSLGIPDMPRVEAASPEKIKIRMDWIPTGTYGAFYYGQRRGVYQEAGLDVEIRPGQGSNATMDDLLRGDIDYGFGACWAIAIGISKGRDVISVATFTGKNGFAFFFPKDSDIKTLADLKGKTIVTAPGMDTLLFPAVLAKNGLSADLMKRLNVDPSQKVATYTRGQADVVNTHYSGSYPTIERQRASNYILWSSVGFVLPDFCIMTTKARLKENPGQVERFLRATYKAAELGEKNPSETAKAGTEIFPLTEQKKTEEEWRLTTQLFYSDDTKGCPHGWHSPSDWTKGLQVLKDAAGLEGSIDDHSKFYTNQFFACSR